MQSMKKRITGDIEVPTSVRFADVPTRKRSSSVSGAAIALISCSWIAVVMNCIGMLAAAGSVQRLTISVHVCACA
jgi:hypothetical protein